MRLASDIGMRFLKSSKGQTLLIIFGIVIGVAVQVFVGSLIDGLQVSLVDGTIGNSSHVTITAEERSETFGEDAVAVDELKSDERIIAVAETFSQNGFILEEDDDNTYPVLLRGFELEDADEIYDFEGALVEGNMPASDKEILVGVNLVDEIEVEIGDSLEFIATSNAGDELEIVGIFDLGVSSLNESWIISDLETAQNLFDEEGQLSNIEIQVADAFAADTLALDIKAQLEEGLIATNWKEENESLLSGLSGQSISSYMIQVFVMIAVLLGIASVLAISGVQKSKQLGILKAMGIKDRIAGQIFLFQGFILGTVGSVIGAAVGVGLIYAFSVFVQNPDGTPLVPFYVDPAFVTFSVLIAIAASTIAAVIPAQNSAKLNPIEVIQNG